MTAISVLAATEALAGADEFKLVWTESAKLSKMHELMCKHFCKKIHRAILRPPLTNIFDAFGVKPRPHGSARPAPESSVI